MRENSNADELRIFARKFKSFLARYARQTTYILILIILCRKNVKLKNLRTVTFSFPAILSVNSLGCQVTFTDYLYWSSS